MKGFINEINFAELDVQKYWVPPASWGEERRKTEVKNMILSGNYIGSRKMDGALYVFLKDEDGEMSLRGRSKSVNGTYLDKIEWVPQLSEFFNSLPNGTCLLGEIYFPDNEGSNHVTTIMGCLKEKALERQSKGDKLHYYVFDVLSFDKHTFMTTVIEKRVKTLNSIAEKFNSEFIEFAKYYEGLELWSNLQTILNNGGGGIVATKKGTYYQPGKRPARQSIKVKRELHETIDVVILGANAPTKIYNGKEIESWQYWVDSITDERLKGDFYSKFKSGESIEPVTKNYWNNWAGSLIIGIRKDDKLVPIGSISGLTEEVLANWQDYKGKVAEVSAMQIMDTDAQGLRHCRFIQWRPDLTAKDTDYYRWFN